MLLLLLCKRTCIHAYLNKMFNCMSVPKIQFSTLVGGLSNAVTKEVA